MNIRMHQNGVALPAAPWEKPTPKPESARVVSSKKYAEIPRVDRKAHSQIAVMRALSKDGEHTAVTIAIAASRGESAVRDALSKLKHRNIVRVDKVSGGRARYSLTPEGVDLVKDMGL